ncbi:circumsporozoite protein-like [Anopheles ziemanni]|uniref:circumsporozoite protein-like n=1 Tax=Anopheles coustani TaxID=139045 RepID=UPI002657B1BA|nr:circumsporozoite protein-like [Anopheles coustani]XP_058169119.1 circumsporozoite protein-like [Anopheles ziemanni]
MVSNKSIENNKRAFNQMANRQRFKQGVGKHNNQMNDIRSMSAMFNANQLGDNPGFMDFNDDSITSNVNGAGNSAGGTNASNGAEVGNKNGNGGRKMNPNMRRPMKNGGPGMRHRMNGMPSWGPPMAPPNMFPGPPGPAGRRGPMNPPPIPPHPAHFRNAHGGGMRMRGPQNGRFGPGPQGPMSLLAMNRPLPVPIPPLGGRPMPPPHAMGRMMPPPLRQGPDGPARRNANGNLHARGMQPFPRNGMSANGAALNVNGKRPRPKNVQNREEYPLDKPWVTEEIKAEHDKKADLANRLKGHRDDALFAQFKEQRDTFVKMYEAARAEFEKKTPTQDVEKMLTETSPCKKVCSESVDKSNDGAISADNLAKNDEANCNSAAPVSDSIKSSVTTEKATDSVASSTATTTSSNASTTDSTATTSTAPEEQTVVVKETTETAATTVS